ncbi:MAG: PAS domain S-box protein, partial [Deltaproteobacteria bacterium]|nr:PAS domain S-box protein [Deltaproteobacteria bacterium]
SRIHEEDRDGILNTCKTATEALKDHELEYRMFSKDGKLVWIYEMVSVLAEGGEPKTLRGFMMDITERRRTEELAAQFGKILEESLNEIFILDAQSLNFIQVNEGARRNIGYSNKELEKLTPLDLKPEFTYESFTKMLEPLKSGEKDRIEFSTIHRRKDGSFYPVDVYLQTSFFGGRKVYVAIILDTTERKKAEEALNTNLEQLSKKNRYEEIISTVTRAVHKSTDLEEVLENAVDVMSRKIDVVKHCAIYFVEGEDAVMKSHRGYPDWFLKRITRIPKPKGFTWACINKGKVIFCPDAQADGVIGPAGKEVGTKSYMAIPLKDQATTIGSINVHSLHKNAFDKDDISLLEVVGKQIEIAINQSRDAEALKNSEERYRTLYQESPSMYFTVNENGDVLSVNRHGIEKLGYKKEELIGHSVFSVFHKEDKPMIKEQLSKCFANLGKILRWDLRKVCKNGSVISVSELARSVIDAGGNKVALIACEDVSERMEAERRLQSAFSEIEILKDKLEKENVYLKEEIELTYSYPDIIGQSKAIKSVLSKMEQVANTDSTVLLTGETGTGKELFSNRIHKISSRKNRVMVKVNCAALPPHLIESELFGHEKGAFT